MEKFTKCEQNDLNNNWMCYIPNTPFMWAFQDKREANKFCLKMDKHINDNGGIKLKGGKLWIVK